jgi:hypothetical protein
MAYTPITAQAVPSAGVDLTSLTLTTIPTGAGNGLSIPADPSLTLVLQNTTGAPVNATLKTNFTVDGVALGDKTHAVPANGFRLVGRLSPEVYTATDGLFHVEAAATGLKLAIVY